MKLNMDGLELPKTEKIKKLTQIMNEIYFDSFTSMCASVLESAISLGRTMGDKKAAKIITELGSQTIVITECDEKTFLVFDLDYQSNFNVILEKMEDYIRKLIFLY